MLLAYACWVYRRISKSSIISPTNDVMSCKRMTEFAPRVKNAYCPLKLKFNVLISMDVIVEVHIENSEDLNRGIFPLCIVDTSCLHLCVIDFNNNSCLIRFLIRLINYSFIRPQLRIISCLAALIFIRSSNQSYYSHITQLLKNHSIPWVLRGPHKAFFTIAVRLTLFTVMTRDPAGSNNPFFCNYSSRKVGQHRAFIHISNAHWHRNIHVVA